MRRYYPGCTSNARWMSQFVDELAELKRNFGKARGREFPDLSVEQRTAPCSDRLDVPPDLMEVADKMDLSLELPDGMIVDTLHKQGPMVLLKNEIPWAGGRKP